MGKKSRKKKKQEKESDGSTGNVNGGSTNSNNNNNHNNNISIPTVDNETVVATTTTTTTMVLTQHYREHIDNDMELKGYPRSNYFVVGLKYYKEKQDDLAINAFKQGADNEGCVPCMFLYVYVQGKRGNFYLLLPYALEGAIRGHMPCMNYLVHCYNRSKLADALSYLWMKTRTEFGDTHCTKEERKEIKIKNANMCCICGKERSEDNDGTTVKCGICKYYSYCGKKCQTRHWKEGKHMHECPQVILLRKYCKPSYVKDIREAIIGGQDPKDIHTLQRLRMKLGLNRPKEDYEKLLLILSDDDTNDTSRSPNRYEYLVGRKDGTVWIGSTPEAM